VNRLLPAGRLGGLGDDERGLAAAEAASRRERHGPNIIIETPPHDWRTLVADTLKDPMLWFLLVASALFAFVGELTESVILLLALLPIFGMDAFLHRRTQASVAGLSRQLATQARVVRDGRAVTLPATELVPGDLVELGPGEPFPADGVLVRAEGVQVDESALTGEAYPVRKQALGGWPSDGHEIPVEGEHLGLAGTRVLTGTARLRVVWTGAETLYGEIVRSALSGSRERTPLQQAVAGLVTILVVAALFICVALAAVRLAQGHGLVDAILSAVTLAVAAIPEEFPVVLTFFLGVGVYRLARRQALVRRAVVVENIGRVTAICSDKTGTITEGRLILAHILPADPEGAAALRWAALAASRAESGDPLDRAILAAFGAPAGGERVQSFPFTEDRKRETGVVREGGRLLAAVKGAPEVVLGQCAIDAAEAGTWLARVAELAGSGHKVIACASRELDGAWAGGEPDRGFAFAGLLAFEDPVRPEASAAVRTCQDARIQVVMVTGDHPATARAVAREIGLGGDAPVVIVGDELEQRIRATQGTIAREIDVVARATPAQKLTLVRALQGQGEIVAVTGDGVNDVPALQAADIGIAMGGRGSQSAREVAAIVLLDDNFRSIVSAIAEGRQLFTNLQLSFQYLLMVHIPLVVTAALVPLLGYPLLYLPIHIVWLELIIHPTALLAFQDLPGNHRLAPPRRGRRVRFFGARQWLAIALAGGVATGLVLLNYLYSLGVNGALDHARAMALMTLGAASAGFATVLTRLRGAAARIIVVATLGLSLLLVQVPSLADLLHLEPLHWDDLLIALGSGIIAALLAAIGWPRSARRSD